MSVIDYATLQDTDCLMSTQATPPHTHIRARSNAILTTGIHFAASSTKYACGVGQAWDSGNMQASLGTWTPRYASKTTSLWTHLTQITVKYTIGLLWTYRLTWCFLPPIYPSG